MTRETNKHQQLQQQLVRIRDEMQRIGLWQTSTPAVCAFMSDVPFSADSMPLEQWIQWMMLPRFQAMIESGARLPSQCGVAPMATHVWQPHPERQPLIDLLTELDALFD